MVIGRIAAHGWQGVVLLDLGNPMRHLVWLAPFEFVFTGGIGVVLLVAFNLAIGILTIVAGAMFAAVFAVMGLLGSQQICENGIVAPDQFVRWKDIVGFRFWEEGVDLTVRMDGPLGMSENSTGLRFPMERRPEVETIFASKAAHAQRYG